MCQKRQGQPTTNALNTSRIEGGSWNTNYKTIDNLSTNNYKSFCKNLSIRALDQTIKSNNHFKTKTYAQDCTPQTKPLSCLYRLYHGAFLFVESAKICIDQFYTIYPFRCLDVQESFFCQ